MTETRAKTTPSTPLRTAVIYAFVFAVCEFLFFFASIAMVEGSGKGPNISYITEAIIDFTVKLLGISDNLFMVVFFWAYIVFVLVFAFILLKRVVVPSSDEPTSSRTHRYEVLVFIAIFGIVSLFFYTNRQHKSRMIEEKQLALEFVKRNSQVMHEAGRNSTVFLDTYHMVNDKPVYYDIRVHGEKTIHAIVEVSHNSGRPVFTLVCTTSLNDMHRDPHKHPCRQ